jgi:hypothetical protein
MNGGFQKVSRQKVSKYNHKNKLIKRRKFTDKMGRNCSTHTKKVEKEWEIL